MELAANTATAINITQSEVRYIPIYLPGYTFDRIGFRSASAWSGTANVRLGIYKLIQQLDYHLQFI
jgi:hypothetical protein